jgi:hypothetical protein
MVDVLKTPNMKEVQTNSFKRHFTFLILLGGLFFISGLKAQNISFVANARQVVRAGEEIELEYSVNQEVDEFTPPEFGQFKYLGGPSTGSSTSIQMINGKTSRSSSYTFTYYIQAPNKAGKYTLAPASAIFNGNKVQSNSLEIEVVGSTSGGNSAGNSSAQPQQPSSQDESAEPAGDDIFIRLEVDKKSAYVGEQINAWIKIYTKANIADIQPPKGPNFTGFYAQEVEIPPLSSLKPEKVGNDIYYTGVMRRVILFPQKSGELVVEPFDVLVEIQRQVKRQSRSIFDDFFGSSYQRSRVSLQSKAVKFDIKPMPGNQPSGFSGAVGKFDLVASASASNVKTNDALTFKVKITGKGNIKLLESLNTNFPADFDVFEPVVKTSIDAGDFGASGTKTFEYTVIPRHAGNFIISPFTFTYFDPTLGSYKTLNTQAFNINVAKGENDSNTVVVSNLSKEDVRLLGTDIRYIETNTKLIRKGHYIFGTNWFFAIYIFFFMLFTAIIIIRRERIKSSNDLARSRNRKATRLAHKRLKKARLFLKSNQKQNFYEEMGKALWGYLSDKLNIPVSELSKERAIQVFMEYNVDSELVDKFFNLTELCEFARFAPGGKDTEMPEVMEQAEEILNKIDDKIRK